ncbi:YbgA family protein [Alkalimarinus sediminis]|uniref:DUF523 and DUF1722 domain-containing protein n=1 Tax=Alkalimarinus sediminis TaxID=1632866 RepID=A0A9E8KPK8_9ALTE|nr:DUF523 and DUF1722 domain-containing protein [Alkalimarinus sediminis]UZW74285.1 DUF523 and DUF1722 domain-containing protein [Alkalimarinus sediminis]
MKSQSIIATDQSASSISKSKHPQAWSSEKINIGLSACLAGHEVRYNGGHAQSRLCLNVLSEHFNYKTFCPEVAAGFSTPRPTMRLTGNPDKPKLSFTNDDSVDLTDQLIGGFKDKLSQFEELDGYILMKNSPSCGLERIKVYQENGYPHETRVQGLFASALQKRYPLMPIEEEGRLHDAKLFENFVLRVYAYHHFRTEVLAAPSLNHLIAFHSSYKYVLMAHSQRAYKNLGRLLGNGKKHEINSLVDEYFHLFMGALSTPASKKSHTNALLHILGYLRKSVPSQARQNIVDVIIKYNKGVLPLITPLTLLKHYLDQHGSEYIRSQRYLAPYPESLGLANQL